MKWIQIASNTPSETFELWNGDNKVAGASFNNKSRIVRMVTSASKRLFFYDKKGWLSPKSFIKNEYGVTLGKVQFGNTTNGFVELEGKKYHYKLNNGENSKIELYDAELNTSVASCNITTSFTKGFNKTKALMNSHFPQLLLLLCWYSLHMQNSTSQNALLPALK